MSQVDLLPNQDSLNPTPRILFLPHQIAESVLLNLDNLDVLFDFPQAEKLLGNASLSLLIHVNSLYNLPGTLFLKSELMGGFDVVDMLDVYRDQVSLIRDSQPDVSIQYDALVKAVESRKLSDVEITSDYLRPTVELDEGDVDQYYVPVLFYLRDGIYGVRLEAVTDLQTEQQIIVANLELLNKSFPMCSIATTDYFSYCIATS